MVVMVGCRRSRNEMEAYDFVTNTVLFVSDLLQAPETYHRNVVRVRGYYETGFETSIIRGYGSYSHNQIWVEGKSFDSDVWDIGLDKSGFVEIIGLFEAEPGKSYGHEGISNSQISWILSYKYIDDAAVIRREPEEPIYATNVIILRNVNRDHGTFTNSVPVKDADASDH